MSDEVGQLEDEIKEVEEEEGTKKSQRQRLQLFKSYWYWIK